ncbi:uncharacterized protein BDZ99DRAFT_526107 [Mytilinidion resinicola]|uniref:Uncharacterized protein n=1 Tax=Mytilinidion resinicola TaxID=574789 RepID=A0A6A6Y6B2_9PEZI|nr:uncharacterized protein BDZ99DRAFT_526107 [Mytilinidion resinicola]KAF2804068.1 hypothetical protein BDZ99DRAFT_526107 [Mytilinidion resinicola]
MPPRAQRPAGRQGCYGQRPPYYEARHPGANPLPAAAAAAAAAANEYDIPPRPVRPPTDENHTIYLNNSNNAEADGDTDSGTDADSNADSDVDADADTNAEAVRQHYQRQQDEAAAQLSYATSYNSCNWARLPGY